MSGFWAITIFTWVAGLVITFFLVRFAVRADEQITILKEISAKQSELIHALMPTTPQQHENKPETNGSQKSDQDYLTEARKKAGL